MVSSGRYRQKRNELCTRLVPQRACFHLTVIRIKAENEGTKTIFSLVVLSDLKAYTVLFILDHTLNRVCVLLDCAI